MPTWGSTYWPIFLIIVSAFFLAPEILALFTNAANTLSDYCWRELSVNVAFGHGKHSVAWWLSLIGSVLAFIILVIHIWWRGP